jgi:hypothetical protein
MPFSQSTLSFSDEDFLHFMHATSPRRKQGITHLIINLIERKEVPWILQALKACRQLPNLVKLEVTLSPRGALKLSSTTQDQHRDILVELEAMNDLQYFDIDPKSYHRCYKPYVQILIEAVPCMRQTE